MSAFISPLANATARFSPLALAVAVALCASPAEAEDDVQFDTSALQSRGLDPKLADLFRTAPRFLPGANRVQLKTNGVSRGWVNVDFDEQGNPCVDEDFLHNAGLLTPSGFNKGQCFDLKQAWPQTEIKAEPGDNSLEVLVPQDAVAPQSVADGNFQHGGVAGLFNYNAQYLDSLGKSGGVNYLQGSTEAGFNAHDWIFRSRQTVTRYNGETSVQHQAALAQRTFTDSKKVLQLGQISLNNSMFSSGQVFGAQFFPEQALDGNSGPGFVEGIASSASVVEVRQLGALVYTTTVPAGPFRLQGFSLLNTRSDLDVTVTGSNGEKNQFIVPAASLPPVAIKAPGLSAGIGRVDQSGSEISPWIATVGRGWTLSPRNLLTTAAIGSVPYRALGVTLDTQTSEATQTQLQGLYSSDARHGKSGQLLGVSTSYKISERISANVNGSLQTRGYRELNDALQAENDQQGNTRDQIGTGLGWSLQRYGSLSLSWAQARTFQGGSTTYVRGSWSKAFNQAYLSVSLEQSNSSGKLALPSEQRAYLTLNIPFGRGQSLSSYLNTSDRNGTRVGTRYNNRLSQDRSWSLAGEQDFASRRQSLSGNMDLVTPVSQLGAGVSYYNQGSTSLSAHASGGVAFHGGGVTLAPYRIGDTFGIARVGTEKGVRIETPAGPTWTDGRGYAVVPSLNSYRKSSLVVDTRSLKKNTDIANTLFETNAARGSVSYMAFDVIRTRRVLVDVKGKDGKPLPFGAAVFDSKNQFVTAVGSQGSVFIPDAGDGGQMDVQLGGKPLCSFNLKLGPVDANPGLYEEASAICQ